MDCTRGRSQLTEQDARGPLFEVTWDYGVQAPQQRSAKSCRHDCLSEATPLPVVWSDFTGVKFSDPLSQMLWPFFLSRASKINGQGVHWD
jgi:hypothetical protein